MKKKTVYTLLVIVFILSFFLTPVGYYGKVWLMRLFSSPPAIIQVADQKRLPSYDWRLKDADGKHFNFEKSRGKVVFLEFWASWYTPSGAELRDVQKLYDDYSDRMDFYMVTNEEQFPVEEFIEKNEYTFPVTYRIVDEPSPLEIPEPSGAYIIDSKGAIVVKSIETKDWYNNKVTQLLDSLLRK